MRHARLVDSDALDGGHVPGGRMPSTLSRGFVIWLTAHKWRPGPVWPQGKLTLPRELPS
jgi:hypothetical protein